MSPNARNTGIDSKQSKPYIEYTMIELCLKKTRVRMDFSFFAIITLFMLFDDSGFGLIALTCCALHELAHLAVMKLLGIPTDIITFYGAGIRIGSSELEYSKPVKKVPVLAAGCAMNFLCAVMFWKFGYHLTAVISLFTGIFNLLPIGELDGAALLKLLIIHIGKPENVDRIMKVFGVFSFVICIAVIMLSGGISFTLLTTAVYLIIVSSGKI